MLAFISYIFSFTILCLLLVSSVIESSAIETHRNLGDHYEVGEALCLISHPALQLWAAPILLFAQGTDLGTIRGTVKDTSGAVIANAKVTVTDLDTNTSRQTNANGAGDFEIFGLKSGRYKVSVTAVGMSTEEIERCGSERK